MNSLVLEIVTIEILGFLVAAVLKLVDPAKSFYNTCLELHAEGTTWKKFKEVFRERFGDVHTNHYHFMRLQTARQTKKRKARKICGSM